MVSVLIVDDDFAVRAFLRLACREEGWDARSAAPGPDGLRLLRAGPEGRVVVLGVGDRLPVADEPGILQAVACEPALLRHYRFLLLTADSAALPPDVRPLARAWAIPILAKPFDLDEVLDAIERAAEDLADGAAS